jgi:hypothetical protein
MLEYALSRGQLAAEGDFNTSKAISSSRIKVRVKRNVGRMFFCSTIASRFLHGSCSENAYLETTLGNRQEESLLSSVIVA